MNWSEEDDSALDHAKVKNMLEKDWDSFDKTIYTDGSATQSATQSAESVTFAPLTPLINVESTVSNSRQMVLQDSDQPAQNLETVGTIEGKT